MKYARGEGESGRRGLRLYLKSSQHDLDWEFRGGRWGEYRNAISSTFLYFFFTYYRDKGCPFDAAAVVRSMTTAVYQEGM